jgi:thiopeptide-type bacteriocin biosynthesis protein
LSSARRSRAPVPGDLLPLPQIVLRTALLPASTLEAVLQPSSTAREYARTLLSDPLIAAAIRVASPGLYAHAMPKDGVAAPAALDAVVRYLARMSTRTAPFGLFAAVSVARLADETDLVIGPRSELRLRARLDHQVLGDVIRHLQKDPKIFAAGGVERNPTVRVSATRVSFTGATGDGFSEVVFERSESLDIVLAVLDAHQQRAPVRAIVDALVAAAFCEEDSLAFVVSLAADGLLLPSLRPSCVGREPLRVLRQDLDALGSIATTAGKAIASIQVLLDDLERTPGIEQIEQVHAAVSALVGREGLSAPVVQVDACRPAPHATFAREAAEQVARACRALERITLPARDSAFSNFRRAFAERFGEEPMPLLDLFDDTIGLRFGDADPFDGGVAARMPVGAQAPERTWTARDSWFAERLADGAVVLELSARDLDELERLSAPTPSALDAPDDDMAALCSVLPEHIGVEMQLVVALRGFLGQEMVARFAHGDDEVRAFCAAMNERYERRHPHALFADLAVHPSDALLNVLQRPLGRGHALCVGGRSSHGEAVALADLVLSLDEKHRFRLWSTSRGCEVIPVGTVNYDFGNFRNAPLVRFLGQLARQGRGATLQWTWGTVSRAFAALPRVVIDGVLVSPRSWLLRAEGVARHGLDGALRRAGVAGRVTLQEADRLLPLDLETEEGRTTLEREVKRREALRVLELLVDPQGEVLRAPEGRTVHQLVLPLERVRVAPAVPAAPPAPPRVTTVPRRFAPGSRWLFLKLYASGAGLESVLGVPLSELLDTLPGVRWFFVRFADPEAHVRLRFDLGEQSDDQYARIRGVVERWSLALHAEQQVGRVCWDTYDREVARYGGDAVFPEIESFFGADARFAHLHRLLPCTCDHLPTSFATAVATSCALLESLGAPPREAVSSVLRPLRDARLREVRATDDTRRFLTGLARDERSVLRAIATRSAHDGTCELAVPQRCWLDAVTDLGARLQAHEQDDTLSQPRAAILQSLLHMHLNRIVVGRPRAEELPVFDCAMRVLGQRAATAGAHEGVNDAESGPA